MEEDAPQPAINTSNTMIAQIDENRVPMLSRTPSGRHPISRSRHSSFRTNSLEPLEPGAPMVSCTGPIGQQVPTHSITRLHSFKRNRPSFIHVTAEAMSRQRSQRLHSRDSQSPWEYQNTR